MRWHSLDSFGNLEVSPPVTVNGYELSASQSFISQIRLVEMTTPNQALVRHDDPTDLKNTKPTCYMGGYESVDRSSEQEDPDHFTALNPAYKYFKYIPFYTEINEVVQVLAPDNSLFGEIQLKHPLRDDYRGVMIPRSFP